MQKLMLILASTAMLCSCRETYTIVHSPSILQEINDSSYFHVRNDSLFFKDKNLSKNTSTTIKYRGVKYKFSGAYDYSIDPELPNILFVFKCSIIKTPWNKMSRLKLKVEATYFKAIQMRYIMDVERQPACCCTNH